ncbi:Aerobic respiration control sensor protein ArcB [compost metagenome]
MVAALDILVVEDVALNRDVVEGLLKRDGHRVWLAEEAGQGMALCSQRRFDLILLDVHLPGISGVELCRQIRSSPGPNQHTRILALTASVQPALVQGFLEAGMHGVLAKPLKLESLRQALAAERPLPEDAADDSDLDHALLNTHRQLLGEQKVQGLLEVLQTLIAQHRSALAEAIAAHDCTEIVHLAHRLAGSSDSLGFCGLARVLRALEEAAMARNLTAIDGVREALQVQMQRAQQTLERLIQR